MDKIEQKNILAVEGKDEKISLTLYYKILLLPMFK
jgi:hypothetical protein